MHLGCFDYYSSSFTPSFASPFHAPKADSKSFEAKRKRNPRAESIALRDCNSVRTCLRVESRNVKKAPQRLTTHNRPRARSDKMNMIKCKRFRKAKWRNTENQLSFWKIVPLIVEWTKSIEKGRWAVTSALFRLLEWHSHDLRTECWSRFDTNSVIPDANRHSRTSPPDCESFDSVLCNFQSICFNSTRGLFLSPHVWLSN